jgi:hypothetical protein
VHKAGSNELSLIKISNASKAMAVVGGSREGKEKEKKALVDAKLCSDRVGDELSMGGRRFWRRGRN